jgi:hypothetical protein
MKLQLFRVKSCALGKISEVKYQRSASSGINDVNTPPPIFSSGQTAEDRDRRVESLIHRFVRWIREGPGDDIEVR